MNETNTTSDGAPQSGTPTFAIVMVTLQLVMMTAIVIGNGLVLVAIGYFRSLRDMTGIFVANLALSDLLLGLALPFQIAFFFKPQLERNSTACLLRYQTISFTCNASLYSLVCTVFDRYLVITRPMTYISIMTKKVAYVMISVVWLVDILIFSASFGASTFDTAPSCLYEMVLDHYFRFFNMGHALILCVLLFLAYMRIFVIARRHMQQIHSDVTLTATNVANMKKAKQMNTVIALVVLLFQLSWLPFFCIQLSSVFEVTDNKVMAANYAVFPGIVNSMLNPVIYVWKNKQYRRAFKRILWFRLDSSELGTSLGQPGQHT